MARFAGALAVLALVSASPSASAASALAAVAEELARGLGSAPAGSLVVASPLTSDVPVTRGEELSLRIASVVAGRLPGNARAHGRALALSLAHAAAKGKPAVVFLKVEIARGELRVFADIFPVVANGWDRIRLPPPAPAGHAYASAPIDAEIHASMPPIPLEQARVTKAKHDEGDVLAVACGDVDGDGSTELVTVTRERVAIGRLRGGRLDVERAMPWAKISPRVPVPLREPLAGAVVVRGHGVLAGVTDRVPFALDAALAPTGPLRGIPLGEDGCAAVDAESSAYTGPLIQCTGQVPLLPLHAGAPQRWDAGAYARVVDASGQETTVLALREPGARLTVRAGELSGAVDGAGAQVAVGDLDLDGVPEIVSSFASPADKDPDAIAIRSLFGFVRPGPGAVADFRQRLRVPAPAGVHALCICPPEDGGRPSVAAIVGDEVWLVR